MKVTAANKLRNALLMGVVSSGVAFVYLDRQVQGPWGQAMQKKFGTPNAAYSGFLAEFWMVTLSLFICAMVGYFLAARYKLPGAGEIRRLPSMLPWFIGAGILSWPVAYLLHDGIFVRGFEQSGWPRMLPGSLGWAAAFIAYSALVKEIILRFGLLTLIAGLFRGRRHWTAVGIISAFAAGLNFRELAFTGYVPGYDLVTISVFAWALLLNAALGAVYVRKGLWAAMALRACVELRLAIWVIFDIS